MVVLIEQASSQVMGKKREKEGCETTRLCAMSEEERPKRLVGWTREQWGRIVAFHGGLDGVRAFLQGSPCRVGPGGGINFARTIVSWLQYEGPLPDPAPTPRQQKRAKAWSKKQQQREADAGGGEGAMGRDLEVTPEDQKMNAPPRRPPNNSVRRPLHFAL